VKVALEVLVQVVFQELIEDIRMILPTAVHNFSRCMRRVLDLYHQIGGKIFTVFRKNVAVNLFFSGNTPCVLTFYYGIIKLFHTSLIRKRNLKNILVGFSYYNHNKS